VINWDKDSGFLSNHKDTKFTSSVALGYWSGGVMECCKQTTNFFYYSITPVLQHSNQKIKNKFLPFSVIFVA